jgi:hypothetical protein
LKWRFYFINSKFNFIVAILTLDVYIITFCFLVSLSVYFKLDPSYLYLQLFPPFLLATILVEIWALHLGSIGKNNVTLYNFFSTFEFCFYLRIISLIINQKKMKRIISVTIIFYAFAATANILFIQKMKTFHTITYALGCLLIVLFCIYYFFELFRLPKSVKLKNTPAFWICSGLLFFYCCGFPLYGFINYWSGIKLIAKNFDKIFTILNIFLYSLFTIAFLCIKTRKYTLLPS